jgi:HEPN domain-containing protein
MAHQSLEKLAKANWVRTHQENYPPRVHNIVYLLEQSDIDLGKDTMEFLGLFNDYQLSGRYPDYERKIHKMCTREFTVEKLKTVNTIRTCLLKMLQ